ncbi:hypothetical protein JKP88DRAFT_290265 [Tribonema minus]|uniref:Uncharacterized protein n=1 Tax=Tribonema minus TaxID=303371 RepID=A0A836CFG0_9STRA|nr:hypothetical protein JKP88DRAFT_290265 [Tribonema minus]
MRSGIIASPAAAAAAAEQQPLLPQAAAAQRGGGGGAMAKSAAATRAERRRAKIDVYREVHDAMRAWRRGHANVNACTPLLRWLQALAALLEAPLHLLWHLLCVVAWAVPALCSLTAKANLAHHAFMLNTHWVALGWLLSARACRPWRAPYQFDVPLALPSRPRFNFSGCAAWPDACKDCMESRCDDLFTTEQLDRLVICFLLSLLGPCCLWCPFNPVTRSGILSSRDVAAADADANADATSRIPGNLQLARAWDARRGANTIEFYRARFPAYGVDGYAAYRAKRVPELVAQYRNGGEAPAALAMEGRQAEIPMATAVVIGDDDAV